MAEMERALDALSTSSLQSETAATLQWLSRVSRESPTAVWEQHFGSVLRSVLDLIADPEPVVREQALRLLRELLKNQVWPGLDIEQIEQMDIEQNQWLDLG